jgi:MoaA/NifB/PqqE/SkfB family radical SAM enzyme
MRTSPELPTFPPRIAIETTSHCNAACPFCPLHGPDSDMTRPKGVMSVDLFEKLLLEIKDHEGDTDIVYLNICGEPLLDPNLASRLELIEKLNLGCKIDMQTNGQFLTEKNAEAVLKAGIQRLTLGFDGAGREVYERHRANCDYDKVVANTKKFIELRNEAHSGTAVVVKFVYTNANSHEVRTAYDLWKDIMHPGLDSFAVSPSENWANRRIDEEGLVTKTFSSSDKKLGLCEMLWSFMNILHGGEIAACCWDYNLEISQGGMGKANEQSLAAIWDGRLFREFRKKHLDQDFRNLPHCSRCSQILGYDLEEDCFGYFKY